MNMKKTIYAVAIILVNPENEKEFLLIRRPKEGELPNIWGLPATTMKRGELPEDCVRRIGREKLGIVVKPIEFIGAGVQERKDAFLHIFDFKAAVVKGEPDVKKATASGTKYVDQRWSSEPMDALPGAEKGSLCEQIFLNIIGIWKKELISKLLDEVV